MLMPMILTTKRTMDITILEKIEGSQHDRNRCTLCFDDGSRIKSFVSVLADLSLYSGMELSEAELERVRAASSKASARARAMRIISARAVSRDELIDRLTDKGISCETAEDTADYLESIGAINDTEYAGMIVRDYSAKGYGMARIKSELYRRGIDKSMWDNCLEEYPDMDEAIDRLIMSKLGGAAADRKDIKRVTDALYRRGFSWDEIKSGVSRYEDKIEEVEQETY